MAKKSILPPILKINLKKGYSPPVHHPPVLPPPEIPPCSSPLPCTELELSRDDQTGNSLGALKDERENGQSEIPLVVRSNMTGEIPLEPIQFLGGEGKVAPMREYPALKSPPAGTGYEDPENLISTWNKLVLTAFCTLTVRESRSRGEITLFK